MVDWTSVVCKFLASFFFDPSSYKIFRYSPIKFTNPIIIANQLILLTPEIKKERRAIKFRQWYSMETFIGLTAKEFSKFLGIEENFFVLQLKFESAPISLICSTWVAVFRDT